MAGKDEEQEQEQVLPSLLRTLTKLQQAQLIAIEECEFQIESKSELNKLQSILPADISQKVKFRVRQTQEGDKISEGNTVLTE